MKKQLKYARPMLRHFAGGDKAPVGQCQNGSGATGYDSAWENNGGFRQCGPGGSPWASGQCNSGNTTDVCLLGDSVVSLGGGCADGDGDTRNDVSQYYFNDTGGCSTGYRVATVDGSGQSCAVGNGAS